MMHIGAVRPGLVAAIALLTPSCGNGVITSDDVSGGEAIVIGLVIVVGLLFVVLVGGRRD